jgi:hypothetical protein
MSMSATLNQLLDQIQAGDRIYVDPSSDVAPAELRGMAGCVDRVEDEHLYVQRPGHRGDPISVPISCVRRDRRRQRGN